MNADPRFVTQYDGYNHTLERFVPKDAKIVLDVGCGRGGMAKWLSQSGFIVDGVSWNSEELEAAATICRHTWQYDVSDGLPRIDPSTYDLVICSHLLEHIAYPQNLLTAAWDALRPGGTILVAIPNVFFWPDRLKLLAGTWHYEKSGTFDYTHLRWYTAQSMTELLHEHNFLIEEVLADGWIPLPGLKYIISKRARHSLDSWACHIFPGLFGKQLIFRARKPRVG